MPGVIELSQSQWCSTVVAVVKKDGPLCICIDFRKLNAISEFDAYPMPQINDLLGQTGQARFSVGPLQALLAGAPGNVK